MINTNTIVDYVMSTPINTNPNILRSMLSEGVSPLPDVDVSDNSKVLTVINGEWEKGYPINGYVMPEWFGAVGDGITNDTQAIQAAINTHIPVLFGAGKTYITLNFVLYNGCKLYGNGATLKRPNLKEAPYNYTDDEIKSLRMSNLTGKVLGENTEKLQIEFRDLIFDFNAFEMWTPGQGKDYVYEQGVGFYCGSGKENHIKILFDNCTFLNNYTSNISVGNYVDLIIHNCKSINCFKGICTVVGSGGSIQISNCFCKSNYNFTAFWYEPNNNSNDDPEIINIVNSIFCGGFQGLATSHGSTNISNTYIESDYILFAPHKDNQYKLNQLKIVNTGSDSIKIRGNGLIHINNCDFTSIFDEEDTSTYKKGIIFKKSTVNDYNTIAIFNNCIFHNLSTGITFDTGSTQKFKVIIDNCIFKDITQRVIGADIGNNRAYFEYCYISNCIFDTVGYLVYINGAKEDKMPIFNGGNDVINTSNQGIYEYGGNTIIFKDEMWSVPVPLTRYRTGASYEFNGIGKRVTLMEEAPSSSFIGINNVDFAQLTVSPYTKYEYINGAWFEIT